MLSVQKNFSQLFRPWDISESKTNKQFKSVNETNLEDTKLKKRKINERRENRLRKIRGAFKKNEPNIHQDDTVSTTTDVDVTRLSSDAKFQELISDSPVANLTLCCDRLLEEPKQHVKSEVKTQENNNIPNNEYNPSMFPQNITPQSVYHPAFVPDYLSSDIAQTLGVTPTDPLLLESLAQGYAMELEYARIMHQENETKLLNARKQRPKKYKCPHCHVGFSNNGQLKGHIRIHTGERPYKCEERNCGKTFTRNEELTRHKRIHSGVRPFPCPTCGKKFGRRDHLKKHTRTHYLQAERMMPVFVPLSAVPHVAGFPYLYGF